MPRNGSGLYSLPAGNPVVTGTIISSTTHNNTMSDIASEMTNSVDKDGQTVLTGIIDHNGNNIVLDTDGDTLLDLGTDDQVGITIAGADDFLFLANIFRALSGSVLETNTINETTAGSGVTIDSVVLKNNTVLAGTLLLGAGSVTDSSGAVSFGNENLSTTGTVGTGALTAASITSGGAVLSDTDSTDSIGSTAVRWLKGWFDTLTAGTLTIGSGSITDSSGAVSFGNENLSTTGTVGTGALTAASITSGGAVLSDTDSTDSIGSTGVRWLKGWFDTLTAGTLTIGSGSIVDSSGAISFGNENLSTTGTAATGALTASDSIRVNDGDNDLLLEGRTDGGSVAGLGASNISVIDGVYASNPIGGARLAFIHAGGAGQRGGMTFASKNTDDDSIQPTVRGVLTPAGKWGFGTTNPQYSAEVAGTLGVSGDVTLSAGDLIITTSTTPASAAAAGVVGTIAWDASYMYVCTATNTWKRVAIATW